MAGGLVEERLRTLFVGRRRELRMTQEALVDRLKGTLPASRESWALQSNVSKYETGDLDADIDTVFALAKALDVPWKLIVELGYGRVVTQPEPVDPLLEAAREALQTGRVNHQAWWAAVNVIRLQAGLPIVPQTLGHKLARRK